MTAHIPTQHEVETYSGRYVDTSMPDPATIVVEDIAHALAAICRYGGHSQRFYSVAEHAVMCSVRAERIGLTVAMQLTALHHDDAEAYLGDIPRPLKPLLGFAYEDLTRVMDEAICEGLGHKWHPIDFKLPAIKNIDNWALFVEAGMLLPSRGQHWLKGQQGASYWNLEKIKWPVAVPDYWKNGLTPNDAEALYLERHDDLCD